MTARLLLVDDELHILKAAEHKRSASASAEPVCLDEPIHMLDAEVPDVGGDVDLVPPAEEIIEGTALAPVMDEQVLLCLLQRT